jgi:hypothetical protein
VAAISVFLVLRVVLARFDNLWRTDLGGEGFGRGLGLANAFDVDVEECFGVQVGLGVVFEVV